MKPTMVAVSIRFHCHNCGQESFTEQFTGKPNLDPKVDYPKLAEFIKKDISSFRCSQCKKIDKAADRDFRIRPANQDEHGKAIPFRSLGKA